MSQQRELATGAREATPDPATTLQDGRKYSEWECTEQLSYAIDVVNPVYILVETHGTELGSLIADDTTIVLKIKSDTEPQSSRSRSKKRSIRRQLRNVMSDVSQSNSSWIVTRSIPLVTVRSRMMATISPKRVTCVRRPVRVTTQRRALVRIRVAPWEPPRQVYSGTGSSVHHRGVETDAHRKRP